MPASRRFNYSRFQLITIRRQCHSAKDQENRILEEVKIANIGKRKARRRRKGHRGKRKKTVTQRVNLNILL